MTIFETDKLTHTEKAQIMRLWNNEYPAQLKYPNLQDVDRYLENLIVPRHVLAVDDNHNVIGWAFSFIRDNVRWFAIIIDGSAQRKGIGTTLLNRLKENETTLCGWVTDHDSYIKQNGEPYLSPLYFYMTNGFTVVNDTRLEIEVLSAVKIIWRKDKKS